MNELSRTRAMIGVGLVAELAQGKLAIRGHDPDHSLELEVVAFMPGLGEPAVVPMLIVRGHAGARDAWLDLEMVDVLADALEFLRPMLELEETTYVAK